jgi:hypothetical protein
LYSYKGDIVKKDLDFNKLKDLRIDAMDLREYFALHTLVEANEVLNIAEKIDLIMVASWKRTAVELQEQGYQINNSRDVLLLSSDVVTNVSKDSLQD